MASGTTIQSNDLPGYFVIHDGRPQPPSNNVLKWYPCDNIRRYVVRYLACKFVFGGHYLGPVKEILAPIEGGSRQALELGTRTGTWTQAMASEFPHVHFRSVDVIPMVPHVQHPNPTFEVYDFTEGLLLEDESQDVVFLNIILEIVNDYQAIVREAYRVLRPGGLIHIYDHNPHCWGPEDITKTAQRTSPHKYRLFGTLRQWISSIGIDPDTCEKLPQWLASGSDAWDQGQHGFRDIRSDVRVFPCYPHDEYPCINMIDPRTAPLMRNLMVTTTREGFDFLKGFVGGKEAERLIENSLEELERPENCCMFKVYCIYATKL
ncbi:methyltransferase domain protein [Ceratobasidium sp. AG-Ba]|nr:methyltransferase domain protein [Ceratobasidium sp. AG-Ba]